MDMGANLTPDGTVFRVWAPNVRQVEVVLPALTVAMSRSADGTWLATVPDAGPGTRYKFRLDGGDAFPDPYSRFQPDGPHGFSEVIDPAFDWQSSPPQHGDGLKGRIIYELHLGTFTTEGTFEAAIGRLDHIRQLGATAIEVMPVAECSGRWNWGYDGVDWFAPSHNYGSPDGFRRLVDGAHQRGLAVLLDVVYNHFGPEGNYLRQYASDYFTDKYQTAWGDAINYEGCTWARKLAVDNIRYWLEEFHVDGFRLDATFAICDASPTHLLRELSDAARAVKPDVLLIAETHENDPRYLRADGYRFDGMWADDFHHVVRRRLAGDHEGYYEAYEGTVDELARTINQGFLYQGQLMPNGQLRGKPAREQPAWQFVYCIENHDQVGNRAFGNRLTADIGLDAYRLASAVLLLLPQTPMLWMGQEFAAGTPFQYFTDHSGELGAAVTKGRRQEFGRFSAFSDPASIARIPDPQAESTFLNSKLNWREAAEAPGREIGDLYHDLLRLRLSDSALASQDRTTMLAAALTDDVLALGLGRGQRLLLANFSQSQARVDWSLVGRSRWRVVLDTNDGRYGGSPKRTAQLDGVALTLDGLSAVLLAAE